MRYAIFLLMFFLATCAVYAQDATVPTHTNGHWYVFQDLTTAQTALTYINGTDWFPRAGKNASHAQEGKDKAKTEVWCKEVSQRLDGAYCFPRIPQGVLAALGVTIEEQAAFFTLFAVTVEVYNESWFSAEEE